VLDELLRLLEELALRGHTRPTLRSIALASSYVECVMDAEP